MQPQDQNQQFNDPSVTTPAEEEDQTINAEQLQPAPSQSDGSIQPPQTAFVDGVQDQNNNDIPEVPEISAAPTNEPQPEMEHLAEPPSPTVGEPEIPSEPDLPVFDQHSSEQTQATQNSDDASNPADITPPSGLLDDIKAEQAIAENVVGINQPQAEESPAEVSSPPPPEVNISDNQPEEDTSPPVVASVEASANIETPTANTDIQQAVTESTETPEASNVSETSQQPQAERVSLTDHGSFEPQTSDPTTSATVASPEEKENIYTEICSEIIKEQEQIIGTLAVEQANYVDGLTVDPATYHCTVIGDGSKVIDDLIEQYRDFFGHAAVEVCKEAASRFLARLPAEEMPTSLR